MATFRGTLLTDSDAAVLRDLEAVLPSPLKYLPPGRHSLEYVKQGARADRGDFKPHSFWTSSTATGPRVVGLSLQIGSLGGPRTALPETLSRLDALEELILSVGLRRVPSWVTSLSSLRLLDLTFNQITTLPPDLDRLGELRYLALSSCEQLPPAIGRLSKLERLHIGGSGIRSLPDLSGLVSLKNLDLGRNQLEAVPESIAALSCLEWLSLFSNKLEILPGAIGALPALSGLSASFNRLETIPPALGALRSLTTLDLGHNRLRVLPQEIGDLLELQRLDLSGNELSRLPDTIGRLRRLDALDLGLNPLLELPTSLGGLTALRFLDLRGTRITALPDSLVGLRDLKRLRTDLSLSEIPSALASIVVDTDAEDEWLRNK